MLRSTLKNKFNIEKTEIANINFKTQRVICTNMLRKAKRAYYKKLNPSLVSDNKRFWKTVRPSFSEKLNSNHNITLIERGQIICDDKKIALIFNDFFANAVKNDNKLLDPEFISETSNKTDPVSSVIEKYKHHPSILTKVKQITLDLKLYPVLRPKGRPLNAIPAKLIKENCAVSAPIHGLLIEYGPICHIVKLPLSMIRPFSLVNNSHIILYPQLEIIWKVSKSLRKYWGKYGQISFYIISCITRDCIIVENIFLV